MKRQAIIIANPGEKGAANYCNGVNLDIENYKSFLQEPHGGLWEDNEIDVMFRKSSTEVRVAIGRLSSVDYGLVIFTGHGYYSTGNKSTIIELRKGEELDSTELKKGAKK